MTCDRLAKCADKEKRATKDGHPRRRPGTRRDNEVHRRLTQQAPHFYYIPTTRIDFRFWKKTEEKIKENLDAYDYYPFGVVSPFGQLLFNATECKIRRKVPWMN